MTALAHERHGNPGAPTVVLAGPDRTVWTAQVAALAPTADVLVVESDSAPPEFAGELLELVDRLGIDTAHLVGHASGGAPVLWLAAHHPRRVRSLVLLCAAADSGTPGSDAPGSGTSDPGTSDPGAPDAGVRRWDVRADLARIVAPTLVIAGAQDTRTPPDTVREVADGIADADYRVFDPGTHRLPADQAGRVAAALRRHLAASATVDEYRSADVEAGLRVRRSVLGDAHVDRAMAQATAFTQPFQDFITRTAWGDIWARPGLDHHTRRLLTLAVLTAVGNEHELDMHIRAALRAGVDPDELAEVFLHTAVYAGVPNSNRAFALGKAALADLAE